MPTRMLEEGGQPCNVPANLRPGRRRQDGAHRLMPLRRCPLDVRRQSGRRDVLQLHALSPLERVADTISKDERIHIKAPLSTYWCPDTPTPWMDT